MSQNQIGADFTKNKEIVYVTDNKRYALAQKDEWNTITQSNDYEAIETYLFIVRQKQSGEKK
jgi:hypothetical protein